jgi:hypothetical protein
MERATDIAARLALASLYYAGAIGGAYVIHWLVPLLTGHQVGWGVIAAGWACDKAAVGFCSWKPLP